MKRQGLVAFALFFFQGINFCHTVPGPFTPGKKEKTNNPPALQQIRFEHLSVADGLTDNSVLDIVQDHLGFIWMGTLNGLVS